MKMNSQQDRIAQELYKQVQWLHDEELVELATQLGTTDISYNGWSFCTFVALNGLISQLRTLAQAYQARVKMRQNLPADRVKDILSEALNFKANSSLSPAEQLDIFCRDNCPSLYRKFIERRSVTRENWGPYHEGYNLSEKIEMIVEAMTPHGLARKMIESASMHRAWLKAIDLTLGGGEVLLWDEEDQNKVQVDRASLLEQREAALQSSENGAQVRWAARRKREEEEAIRRADEEKKRAAADRKAAKEREKARKEVAARPAQESNSTNNYGGGYSSGSNYGESTAYPGHSLWYERERDRITAEKSTFDWEGKCTYDPWGSHLS